MSALIDALLAANKYDEGSNPLMAGGLGLAKFDASQYDLNPWESVLVNSLKGLGSGLAYGYGSSQVKQQQADRAQALIDAVGNKTGSSLVDAIKGVPGMEPYAGAIALENADQQRVQRSEANKSLIDRGLMYDENGQIKRLSEVIGQSGQAPIASPVAESTSKPLFGDYPTFNEKQRRLIQEGIDQGLTPNKAADYAKQSLEVERAQNKDAIDTIKAAREKANALEDIAAQAEAGVQGAGNTGGPWGGIRDLASSVWAQFSPEEMQQRSSQKLIDAVAPDVIKLARSKGAGATSDFEARMYLGSGPSSAKTPQENQALIENMRNLAGVQKQYASFLETYLADKGDLQGAEQAWDKYKKDNPLFSGDQPNPNRQNWQEYFQGGANGPAATSGAGGAERQGYTVDELRAAGYSDGDIQALRSQGMVQ